MQMRVHGPRVIVASFSRTVDIPSLALHPDALARHPNEDVLLRTPECAA
jgi:hypothetical protein